MKPKDPNKELKVCWSKKEKDLMIHYPKSCDGHFINYIFNSLKVDSGTKKGVTTLMEALKERGYNIETLKFSIKKKSFLSVEDVRKALKEMDDNL